MASFSIFLLSCLLLVVAEAAISSPMYVDPVQGSDNNSGTRDSPYKTVVYAATQAQTLSQTASAPVTVYLASGVYAGSNQQMSLPKGFSGTSISPIVFQADPDIKAGEARPLLSAGMNIPVSAFNNYASSPDDVTIYTVDLQSLGVPASAYGDLAPNTLGSCPVQKMEVFYNDSPMLLARYPNFNATSGYSDWMSVDAVQNTTTSFSLKVDSKRTQKWQQEKNLWFHGYWVCDTYIRYSYIHTHRHHT